MTETPSEVMAFRELIQELLDTPLDAPASRLGYFRKKIADRLQVASDPFRLVRELLNICSENRTEGGLHVGVFVLSNMGDLALKCAQKFFEEGLSGRPDDPTGDDWYVVLYAAASARVKIAELLSLMRECLHVEKRGVQEAVVEALSDLRTPEAKRLLIDFMFQSSDGFIRKMAFEELQELE